MILKGPLEFTSVELVRRVLKIK